jgi:hypothetical protein
LVLTLVIIFELCSFFCLVSSDGKKFLNIVTKRVKKFLNKMKIRADF